MFDIKKRSNFCVKKINKLIFVLRRFVQKLFLSMVKSYGVLIMHNNSILFYKQCNTDSRKTARK